jgi:hypothetical protein
VEKIGLHVEGILQISGVHGTKIKLEKGQKNREVLQIE